MSLKTPDLFSVAGKVAIVTGGTRGIGLMIARGLVQNGATVWISSRKQKDVEEIDLNCEANCQKLAAEVAKHHNKVHVLFNNAGITWGGSLEEYPESAWNKLMTVNVASVFHMTRACLPMLLAAVDPEDPPRVVNVGSIAAFTTSRFDNAFAYAASKAAVAQLTRVLSAQLTPQGINVNCIAPGVFPSKMARYFTDDETRRDVALSMIPAGSGTVRVAVNFQASDNVPAVLIQAAVYKT